jgi:transposase InsO family protein
MIPDRVEDKLFSRRARQGGIAGRKAMIDRNHALPISGQARALGISRGSVYYLPRSVSAADLVLMRRIDELHLDYPFAGSRMLQGLLLAEGHKTGRLHIATLMKRMGIMAIYRRPNTSKPEPGHKIFPYLLRKLPVIQPNQVWAMDITYIPMEANVDRERRALTQRFRLSGGGDGLVQPQGSGLAAVDHHGQGVLH